MNDILHKLLIIVLCVTPFIGLIIGSVYHAKAIRDLKHIKQYLNNEL